MSNQAQIDYDRQFQEDLAKATALSLEQQALDDYRRNKKYGTGYQTVSADYYSQQQQQQQQRSHGAVQRRHSEVHQASSSYSSSAGRSSTPPAQANNGNGDNDLICFASPTTKQPTSESGSTFERLIEDLQRLQTNSPQTALVPVGPVAAATPMPVQYAAPPYGVPPLGGAGGVGMQLVPYQAPPQQPQQRPLNNEELQRLYSMPNQLALQPVVPVQPAGFVYYPTFSAPVVPGSAAYLPPQYPSQAYGYSYALSNGGSSHVDFARPHSSPATAGIPTPVPTASSSHSVPHSGATTPAAFNVRRATPPVGSCPSVGPALPAQPQRSGNDLIDLKQDDYSRVSVLEAFDPLLNENSGNDGASDCTSYYADYDPFDFLYSGDNGTQYSDPMYEAVNRWDKSAVNSGSVSSIGWRQDYLTQPPHSHSPSPSLQTSAAAVASAASTSAQAESRSNTGSVSPPPPLPPRNQQLYEAGATTSTISQTSSKPHQLAPFTDSYTNSIPAHVVLDRRKNFTRLYQLISEQRSDDTELLEFYHMVRELRASYKHDDKKTNVGHIIAAEFNYHYMMDTSIKVIVHPAVNTLQPHALSSSLAGEQVKGYGTPVTFTCDIDSVVAQVVAQALASLEGQVQGTVTDYAVKPIGLLEWLAPTSKLSQLECVHNSFQLEKDVHLGLCLRTAANMEAIARTALDDENDADLQPEQVLPNEVVPIVTYDNMMILIETLETEIDKLESSADGAPSGRCIVSCSGVVQAVKAICALLGSIDTLEIARCISDLKRICEEAQTKYAPLAGSNNPEIISDYGEYAQVTLRPRSMLEQIKLKCNSLRDAVQELIELYANVFRVAFSVKTPDYATTPIPVSCVSRPIVVSINCLHRPPPNWKYDDYSLCVQLVYGTRLLSNPNVLSCSNDTSGGLFPRLNFSAWLTFEQHQICTLPREARLTFVLYGKQTASENEPNAEPNGERRQVTTELGWCSIQLFDFKRTMICGPYLLSVWPPTTDKMLGPAPARGCHPHPDFCPVLSIEVPSYGGRIEFPEHQEIPKPAPHYDFASLDANLQEELLNTAELGYSGATERREVFWEKRLYLQNYPNALPKVLHAAHSWDYANLIDLHSLLHSWAPLSPLQALELLLPRYPDAKVREKAVEWISHMPNDQLVDFLPQLVQSLKHDTYEASALSRFLLAKCLESPRFAHHMYWLLVHSLPDDPLNSIGASLVDQDYDESQITQARYYRRNKMMLRALMAICGEKLLKRFMYQHRMCQNLSKIAESVKEAKESMRQKSLVAGMDEVHQDLVEKPTCLPLGPELEVSGVNVRNCSYFNSNTLPLKITFVGPDAEPLPAIFKCGDDLQQDMLTIQLIRIMNKMWLAERLDLKMVTFNCVPTGYKRGMIELVSEAETLRKIQVECGLTGSFKDRPIAEWLGKQNPSPLEYQSAVRNFTLSCAGYSVATYVLGICDRHNDNIMLKTSGHLFHIDFGKFLGDAQMFGNFKRDRTPFVLTSDMAYVINGGDKPSTDFHYFVDLCCRAFNIVRKNADLLLHTLAHMATAGMPGVNSNAVTYVRRALLPSQSNPEAAATFAKMIQSSLKSWFTQFNFFLHNLAQMRFNNDEGSGELLSFVPRKYTMQQDGRLKIVKVVRFQKHYSMEKYYMYILQVTRHGQLDPTHLFRSYREFTEFHQKLCMHFPLVKLHSLPTGVHVGRSNIKSVAEKRLPLIQRFLKSLFDAPEEIAHSDLVYTFFHPLLRDQQEAKLEMPKIREVKRQPSRDNHNEIGQIRLSLQYQRGVLTVMIHHAKGLPMLQGGQEPNTYVKCYLKPDPTKETKRKTKVVRKTCVPSFMETLEYRMPLEIVQQRRLQVTVWSHDTLQENELLGGFELDLSKHDLRQELCDWHRLGSVPRN
ncbi:PREDICTED: phosphatidylinositol 4-phosphate 3-kinase C2 domain-containing subunit alpha [Drosophila arizonae]|uniref:Phosphatidylinositol 4-phosphate 3-kinase C2 domain-containing subunit alpha n=1 Tax=Drosophila arizonae TaxID=7263 RepID=A0ABM1P939_DROAR|nr:PREDICTED: phosphatidylinositol 4-phosphate 3-kinase C2 domain-containing subunit alpha [Drosophila arizonae]XP_017863726.1 PREDICTED: phosphatidylinositol 4-phosphate 3-kinase C2 domain-containing subunit alpha [Drosophila arizonae]XP_017863727.1 PREDICTED: phosphatidylinositol 4-phosphate 3-kinase C2 domain-containing subunit alpha [Drosophila arizonae]XP_017863728.1 PREDICTED: phosphatidylinositol 4-phosphate 3-kinase C2 domain-containing subunit alpha [Drosophila arizonae]